MIQPTEAYISHPPIPTLPQEDATSDGDEVIIVEDDNLPCYMNRTRLDNDPRAYPPPLFTNNLTVSFPSIHIRRPRHDYRSRDTLLEEGGRKAPFHLRFQQQLTSTTQTDSRLRAFNAIRRALYSVFMIGTDHNKSWGHFDDTPTDNEGRHVRSSDHLNPKN